MTQLHPVDPSPLNLPPRRPATYRSRLVAGVQLWNEAARAAKYPDSIFIWIPKNAGTSIYNMLRENGLVKLNTTRHIRFCFRNSGRVTFGHMGIAALVELGLVSPEFIDRSFKFAIARDPYARALSLYHYLLGTVIAGWHQEPTFDQFLRILADGLYDRVGAYNVRGLSQCAPQVEWLRGITPDKIYKVEQIDELVADLSSRWNIASSRIPHLNRSGSDSAEELTRQQRDLIERIYSADFETFGYPKR